IGALAVVNPRSAMISAVRWSGTGWPLQPPGPIAVQPLQAGRHSRWLATEVPAGSGGSAAAQAPGSPPASPPPPAVVAPVGEGGDGEAAQAARSARAELVWERSLAPVAAPGSGGPESPGADDGRGTAS